jgi:hypothetical protein
VARYAMPPASSAVIANAEETSARAWLAAPDPGAADQARYAVPNAATPTAPATWRLVVKTPLMSAA